MNKRLSETENVSGLNILYLIREHFDLPCLYLSILGLKCFKPNTPLCFLGHRNSDPVPLIGRTFVGEEGEKKWPNAREAVITS